MALNLRVQRLREIMRVKALLSLRAAGGKYGESLEVCKILKYIELFLRELLPGEH